MRRLIVTFLLASFAAVTMAADPGDPADSPAVRRAAAERYASVVDFGKMLSDVTGALVTTLPEEKREEFRKIMTEYLRAEVVREATIIVMARHFTAAELNTLADFYGSEVGKSAIAKMGPYMQDLMPLIQAEVQHAVELSREAQKKKATGA